MTAILKLAMGNFSGLLTFYVRYTSVWLRTLSLDIRIPGLSQIEECMMSNIGHVDKQGRHLTTKCKCFDLVTF